MITKDYSFNIWIGELDCVVFLVTVLNLTIVYNHAGKHIFLLFIIENSPH